MDLLTETSFDKIRVTDICDKAMVHRSTFYTYFESKEHLLTYRLQNIIHLVSGNSKPGKSTVEANHDLKKLLDDISSNQIFYTRILVGEKESGIRDILHDLLSRELLMEFKSAKGNHEKTNISLNIASQYYSGATIAVITWWLKNKLSISTEKLAEEFNNLTLSKYVFYDD